MTEDSFQSATNGQQNRSSCSETVVVTPSSSSPCSLSASSSSSSSSSLSLSPGSMKRSNTTTEANCCANFPPQSSSMLNEHSLVSFGVDLFALFSRFSSTGSSSSNRSPSSSPSKNLVVRPLTELSSKTSCPVLYSGQWIGPIENLFKWLQMEVQRIDLEYSERDTFLSSSPTLNRNKRKLFENPQIPVQIALTNSEQNLEIVHQNGQYYFKVLRTFRVKYGQNSDSDNDRDTGDEEKEEENPSEIGNCEPAKVWLSNEIEQRLVLKPGKSWLNGNETHYCLMCNHYSPHSNHILLHMILTCAKLNNLRTSTMTDWLRDKIDSAVVNANNSSAGAGSIKPNHNSHNSSGNNNSVTKRRSFDIISLLKSDEHDKQRTKQPPTVEDCWKDDPENEENIDVEFDSDDIKIDVESLEEMEKVGGDEVEDDEEEAEVVIKHNQNILSQDKLIAKCTVGQLSEKCLNKTSTNDVQNLSATISHTKRYKRKPVSASSSVSIGKSNQPSTVNHQTALLTSISHCPVDNNRNKTVSKSANNINSTGTNHNRKSAFKKLKTANSAKPSGFTGFHHQPGGDFITNKTNTPHDPFTANHFNLASLYSQFGGCGLVANRNGISSSSSTSSSATVSALSPTFFANTVANFLQTQTNSPNYSGNGSFLPVSTVDSYPFPSGMFPSNANTQHPPSHHQILLPSGFIPETISGTNGKYNQTNSGTNHRTAGKRPNIGSLREMSSNLVTSPKQSSLMQTVSPSSIASNSPPLSEGCSTSSPSSTASTSSAESMSPKSSEPFERTGTNQTTQQHKSASGRRRDKNGSKVDESSVPLSPNSSNGQGLNLPPYFLPPSGQSTSSSPLLSSLYLLSPSLTALSYQASNVCAYCNTAFRMTSDLVYHMRSHHKKSARESTSLKKRRDDQLRCNICNETFRERHHLTRHMTSHQ